MYLAVFYGGKICELGVSIVTGVSVASALYADGMEVVAVYIDRNGRWWSVKNYTDISAYESGKLKKTRACVYAGDNGLYVGRKRVSIDCAVLCTHGAGGEDGCLQGTLSLCGIAFTGTGVLGSAVGMNKAFCKTVFSACGLNTVDGFTVHKRDVATVKEILLQAKIFGYPLIVKPCSLGSSIGVSVAWDESELISALDLAFCYDESVLIERKLNVFSEFNCAVLFDGENYLASEVEKPVSSDEILSFADKYERGGFKGEGLREFPAIISDNLRAEIQSSAITAFRSLGGSGIARVDFLFDGTTLYINEINTIPGSLALYLFPEYRYNESVGECAVLYRLIDTANANGRHDNITAVLVRI